MDPRRVSALLAAIVALSLVGAPVTMADWGEQASFSADRIELSEVEEETPIIDFERLSADAQKIIRGTVESPDGHYTVYGTEDWPGRFFYSDYIAPGQGLYVIVYEGQYYRLTTYASGGFPFVYWLLELPFVVYGLVLARIAHRTYRGERSVRTAGVVTLPGIAFHLLGPEFDFPVFEPMQFVGLGVLATATVTLGFIWTSVRERRSTGAE